MVIAVDFDGTLTDKDIFPQIGEMKEYALEAIHNLQAAGNKIVLWTCREGRYLDDAREWLNEHGIDLDFYNKRTNYYINEKRKNANSSLLLNTTEGTF